MAAQAGTTRAMRLGHKKGGFHFANNSARAGVTKTELDAAKNVLRRRGYIVYDAEVTNGIAWRGWIKCDGRLRVACQIIEMAKAIEAAP
jgi:hypothetical protein